MITDIRNRKDVEHLVDEFYKRVLNDDTIGFIFTETIEFIWEKHIPIMYNFWESMLFDTAVYNGNPMSKHIDLNAKIQLTDEHFKRWLELWRTTIETNFKGETADKAKEKANTIAELMKHKIRQTTSNTDRGQQ